ncbi:MAG: hypothetical protein RI894_2688 [Bacteroidota bacterium]|jgi:deoxyadenosine/deoxycytidine kinase
MKLLHHFLVIEGNIGAGKTSLCNRLSEQFDTRLVLEQFADNPFLADFYAEPARHAFTVELFFMSERYKQLQDLLLERELFQTQVVADYFFIKTLLFAGRTLEGDEFRLFKRFFKILNKSFPTPDLLVYIHRPVDALLKNIQKRGRNYEKDLSGEYLENIQSAYFDYFKSEPDFPILIIDVQDKNYLENEPIYNQLIEYINKSYKNGVHRVAL